MSQENRSGLSTFWECAVPAIAILAASLTWSGYLLRGALRHWDEAWYAEVSREMLETGSWLTVRWNDAPWFHKPPLTFWGTAGLFHLFGISETTARLFSFLSGLAVVGLVAGIIGRRLGAWNGLAAGLFLASIPEFARYAARGQLDVPLTLFLTVQLIAFGKGLDRPPWHLASGLAFGLALMTKGAAAGLALVIECAYMLVARDGRPLRQLSWWASWGIGLVLAAPWHLHQIVTHGQAFTRDYFDRHLVQFFSDIYPEVDSPGAPAWYYLDFLLRKEAAWGWLVLAVVLVTTIIVLRGRDRALLFVWCWTIAVPVALSLAWAKWSWYLVPMYPGLALLTVMSFAPLLEKRWPRQAGKFLAAIALIFCVVTMGSGFLSRPNKENESFIRALGPEIACHVPPTGRILTLQVTSSRQSIYPIATRFYGQRTVQVTNGIDDLASKSRGAGNIVYAVVHADLWPEVTSHSGYEVEMVARSEDVVLARLVPAWLAEEVRQAARKTEESR